MSSENAAFLLVVALLRRDSFAFSFSKRSVRSLRRSKRTSTVRDTAAAESVNRATNGIVPSDNCETGRCAGDSRMPGAGHFFQAEEDA